MTRWNTDLKVGFFILLSLSALFFMTFKIGGTIPFFGHKGERQFVIIFSRVSGVSEKSNVKMAGVDIGKVRSIELEGRKAKVTIDLDANVNIPVDSVASIRSAGLLGEKFIDISPGETERYVENGAVLKNSIDPTDIDEMMTKLSSALDDIKLFTSSLSKSFGSDDDGKGGLKTIIDNLVEMTSKVKMIVADNEESLSAIINNARDATKLLKEILAENRGNVKEGMANFKNLTGDLSDVVKENRENFRTAMANLRTSSEKLDRVMASAEQVAAKLEKGEGTIGKLIQEEEIYDSLNKTLKGAQETLAGAQGFMGRIDDIKIGLGLRSERLFDYNQTKSYFSIRIKPREDKYYLLEISEDVRRTSLTSTRNTLNSLMYTFIVAKRFGDVTFKGGLMESSGGIGLDFHAWRDSITLSAALFNLSGYDLNAENPQLKLTGRFYIQKYLFIYVGGDELLNDYYRTYLAGVGLMVDEEDFKFFLSLF